MFERIKTKILTKINDIIHKLIADSYNKTREEMYDFVVENNILSKDFMDYIANATLSDSFSTLLSSLDYVIETIKNTKSKLEGEVFYEEVEKKGRIIATGGGLPIFTDLNKIDRKRNILYKRCFIETSW